MNNEEEIRDIIVQILRNEKYSVDEAGDGIEAIEKLKKREYDVVLTDLMMPNVGGLEVIEEAKSLYSDIVTIIMTAYATMESAVEALNLGAYGFVEKPYDVDQLLLTIRRAIEKREVEAALREAHKRYENVIESASDIIADMDADGKLVFVNTYALRRLGYAKDEVLGRGFQDFVAPASRPEASRQ